MTDAHPATRPGRIRVLHLARNFPNNEFPRLGLWTERLVRCTSHSCEAKVIAPVPYCPPIPGLPENFARFRRVERHRRQGNWDVFHPRFFTGPGLLLHNYESLPFYWGVVQLADRLRREFPFDLIHAHFVYPDGVVGARLAQRYGVPLIITEHASWRPWMEKYPRVRRQALQAFEQCAFLVTVSHALRDSVAHFTGNSPKLRVIPNVVDQEVFRLPEEPQARSTLQLLFVGQMRHVKGVDVLLRALRLLAERGHPAQLAIVGESFYAGWLRDQEAFRQLVNELHLNERVRFLGGMEPAEVAHHMQQSALVVLPSRRESFGVVLAEALACGTPVVSTRCGGPEDIVTDEVGALVPPEDPEALAQGIERVLANRKNYDPPRLRAYAIEKFGLETVGLQLGELYREALSQPEAGQ